MTGRDARGANPDAPGPLQGQAERCLLVGLELPEDDVPVDESLDELARLVESAGGVPVGRVVQSRRAPDASTYVGPGKVHEIAQECERLDAGTVVFDGELTPRQVKRLEDALNRKGKGEEGGEAAETGASAAKRAAEGPAVKVVDRTQLILDIFAQRAQTKEGKLQVEYAQCQYLLPRLAGRGAELSRLGGGIGTRGPGESKLETDRRRLRARMAELRRELAEVKRQRAVQREGRRSALAVVAALVGYTNAGKSTLLNALTGAAAYADDRLFATLDPTIRRANLPQGGSVLLVDTVGFIRKLPHQLVAAFRATLEEVNHADVLIHVIDLSSESWYEQAGSVHSVLEELGASEKPIVTVFNKIDRVDPREVEALLRRTPGAVAVSAKERRGFEELLEAIGRAVPEASVRWTLEIPYGKSQVLSWLHEYGRVVDVRYDPDAVRVEAELRRSLAGRVAAYRALKPQAARPDGMVQ